ncbi:MAG: peptidoglycan DD-metalloendopeptidase family protein [Sphingomonadaceae bacterium]|nr:peptidoglycan DD-metalloendopeptidase family protein [Blastomonas marina]
MTDNNSGGLFARLRSWFPEREFFMRSQGQVRFIKISSRVQIAFAAIAVGATSFWVVSLGAMGVTQYLAQSERTELLDREAKVASAESRVTAYRDDLDAVADDLGSRQEFIERMTEAHLGILPDEASEDTVTDSSEETQKAVEKIGLSIPEARGLAELEARQLAYVERLTRYADQRSQRASAALKQLGLNPKNLLASVNDRSAMGGPVDSDGEIDPRFVRLGLSLARMDALERGLAGVPQYQPAAAGMVSSSYGYRRDPFTRRAAFHSGLDYKGHTGAAIRAAAAGTVVFVGRKGGYGNLIEVRHDNGLTTRYAHLSGFKVKVGQKVVAGQHIGAMGSTGRSTGPHLHFEVRQGGKPLNPRAILEKAPNVLKEIRGRDAALAS